MPDVPRHALWGPAVAAAVALGFAALGQAIPPFHILSHEFTQGLGLVGLIALAMMSPLHFRGLPPSPDRAEIALGRALSAALVLAGVAWAAAAFATTQQGCVAGVISGLSYLQEVANGSCPGMCQ